MLNKDQYNQDEYNDYYRQEIEGSELKGGGVANQESGVMGKIIPVVALLVLGVGGYFGYKAMSGSSDENIDSSLQVSIEPSLPQSVQEETPEAEEVQKSDPTTEETEVKTVTKEESSPQNNTQDSVTQEVTKVVAQKAKMSPEEVASIVAAVMKQMSQKESTQTTKPIAVKQDKELMDELSSTEVDSVSTDLEKELEKATIDANTHIDNSKKQIDVYNKVNVQDLSGDDELSQLSSEINSVISEGIQEDEAQSYTANIKKEVATRQNEMRIIIVKKGDTLGKLAQRAYGNVMDYKKIYRANPEITRPDRIYIGQKIRIPK